jgi:DnaK suppressor protein
MTQTELNKFSTTLTSKYAELTGTTAKRDGIAIERTADALDQVQFAAQRELSSRNLERESLLLRNVGAALGRIANGTYGECLECEEEISLKRLQAVPWATRCIACQEDADRNSQARFTRLGQAFDQAA